MNKFTDVEFDFRRFLDKFNSKSTKMIVLSTCRTGNELDNFKSTSMEFFRRFEIVDLNNYAMCEAEGEQLAKEAGVVWKPEHFHRTPGSVLLDDEDMIERYKHIDDYQKTILRTCKLLRSANVFSYKKDMIKNVCEYLFETKINENIWIDSITRLESNSLITKQGKSINEINVHDTTLDSVVYDYLPIVHFSGFLILLIKLKDAKHLFHLAKAFVEKKDYENAEKCYRKTLEFNPDHAAAHASLGNLLKISKRYEEAEKEYKEAIRLTPDYPASHYSLGNLLKISKRYEEAEKEYREAIRLTPDYPASHYSLGNLLKISKRYEEAEKEYREAIRLNLDYAIAHASLGNLLKIWLCFKIG